MADYADLMVESGPPDKVARLQIPQDRAVRVIDDGRHSNLDISIVSNLYRLIPLNIRRDEHLSLVMFLQKADRTLLDNAKPNSSKGKE